MQDDVIYRQQAIDKMRKLQRWNVVRGYNKNEGFLYDDVMFTLEKLPPAQPETYEEKLKEIADALSEKFAYMNTCLNERDIILGYLGVKRPNEIHCNTDCTNIKCESYRCDKRLSPAQCNYKKMNTVYGLDGTVYTQDKDKQGWTGYLPSAQSQQKKGHWITYHYLRENWSECECDQCHKYAKVAYDFCPNCGADMRD